MRSSGGLRFAAEVAFIVTVAVGAAAARLSNVGIAVSMAAAFLLVAAVEILRPRWAASRGRSAPARAHARGGGADPRERFRARVAGGRDRGPRPGSRRGVALRPPLPARV